MSEWMEVQCKCMSNEIWLWANLEAHNSDPQQSEVAEQRLCYRGDGH